MRQVSANVADLLGRPVDAVQGRHLSALIGSEQAGRIEQAAATFGGLRQNNPLEITIEVAGEPRAFDAILHRAYDEEYSGDRDGLGAHRRRRHHHRAASSVNSR
ncbi:hypothetical protein [Mycobacterium arosiense]|uniref:hypothetical protein n=1 Tax=Mycobacterium arosiense TaxID=425468 RepID=UPI0027BA0B12|nr:hypothetical protein [Mycobacterium arosiense]